MFSCSGLRHGVGHLDGRHGRLAARPSQHQLVLKEARRKMSHTMVRPLRVEYPLPYPGLSGSHFFPLREGAASILSSYIVVSTNYGLYFFCHGIGTWNTS